MIKNCRICGKEFETPNSRYCTCSHECSIKNRAIMQKKYHLAHPKYNQRDKQREKSRQRFIPCRICGENVPSVFNAERYTRKQYHEECVVGSIAGDKRKCSLPRQQNIQGTQHIQIHYALRNCQNCSRCFASFFLLMTAVETKVVTKGVKKNDCG